MYYEFNNKTLFFSIFIVFVSVFLLIGFSPVLGCLLSLCLLALGVGTGIPVIRVVLSLFSIWGMVFTACSRYYNSGNSSDDFSNVYLPVYNSIVYTSGIFNDAFSDNYEYFLSALLNLFTWLNGGGLTPFQLMLLVSGLSTFLFYLWLEIYGLKGISSDKKTLCIAFSLGFFQFMIPLQYMRQIFALIFILYSLSEWDTNKRLGCFFLILAILSHSSTFLIFPLFKLLMSNNYKMKKIVMIALGVVTISYTFIFSIISNFGSSGIFYKLTYYSTSDIEGRNNTFGYFKFIFISLVASKWFFSKDINSHQYKNLLYSGAIFYLILFPIPEFPLRIMGILLFVLTGYIIFLSTYRMGIWVRFLFVLYLILYGIKLSIFSSYTQLANTDQDFMSLWYSYPWFGDNLFYYLVN